MPGIQRSPSAHSFGRRDAERDRYYSQQAQNYVQLGSTLVVATSASDESVVIVTFSNVFTDRPFFHFGSVLDINTPAVSGSFPTASATVIDWATVQLGPFTGYTGATLGIVTTGIVTQRLWIDYSFTGKALSFPAGLVPTGGSVTA